jgi:hypothetical protein
MKTGSMAILLAVSVAICAAETKAPETVDAKAAFAKLKTLAGVWEADTSMGKVRTTYEVIAGGSTIVERESGEKMPVMLTLYHLDGDRLLLTHYCAAGNQPRMLARRFDPAKGELRFEFLDATGLADGGGHMRNATIRFDGDRSLSASWEFYQNGKLKSTENWRYARVQ